MLIDGRIQIKLEKWLVPIVEKYPALEKRYRMLEPEKGHHNEGRKRVLEGVRSDWLATVDKVRTRILLLNKDIFIPELALYG